MIILPNAHLALNLYPHLDIEKSYDCHQLTTTVTTLGTNTLNLVLIGYQLNLDCHPLRQLAEAFINTTTEICIHGDLLRPEQSP
jgi:hypothetical protein